MIKNPELHCARAIMTYADALMRAHHVDRVVTTDHLLSLVHDQFHVEIYEDRRKTA